MSAMVELLPANGPANPIVRRTRLRVYPGWEIRQYLNGMYDARHDGGALSPGCESWHGALAHVKREERPTVVDQEAVDAWRNRGDL